MIQMTQLTLFPLPNKPYLDHQRNLTIASWNVNSVRARQHQIITWIRKMQPDVLCIQETKVKDNLFPQETFLAEGYQSVIFGQARYNGVAILSKYNIDDPVKGLRENCADYQARVISARVCGVNIICVYAPDARSVNHESFSHKLDWFDRLNTYLRSYYKRDENVILCGDLNVAPTDSDVFDSNSWLCKTYVHPQVRLAFKKIESWGLVDLLRRFGDSGHSFTWWNYGDGFPNNEGMRLDHILGSEKLASRLTKIWVDKEIRAAPKPSDHAPIICSFITQKKD